MVARVAAVAVATAAVLLQGAHTQGNEVHAYRDEGDRLYRTHHEAPGRFPEAIRMYEKALEKQPGDYRTLWRLAMFCQIYGQTLPADRKDEKLRLWEKGMGYGKRAMEANPDGKEGHFYYMGNLGAIVQARGTFSSLWHLGRIKRAMDRTLELDPDFPPALVARAQFLTRVPGLFGGDASEALLLYRRALEVDPGYHLARYHLAEMSAGKGRYDEALENLNRIIDCPEEERSGTWATLDLPRAEALRREILRERGDASRRTGNALR